MGSIPAELEARIDGERLILFFGTAVDGQQHVVPVWYYYEDGHVQITTDGRAARNERVSAALQADTGGYPDWMATLVTDAAEVAELTERIYAKYMGSDRDEWHDDVYWETVEDPELDRVTIDVDIKSEMYREF